MVDDLKIIKKQYGEKMSHLCRELFPTLLETPGRLSEILLKTFEPSKLLYEDLMQNNLKYQFQNFIYGLTEPIDIDKPVTKTPKELLDEAGYILYECNTEEEVQSFKKYYAPGEELCTFNGGRLNRCHVFFAVKKDVDKIKRENFKSPRRQDEYGTSVISIQFSRGTSNTLSIKNRYNHTVENPDATFSNNLDNIALGLTDSFEKEYGLDLSHNRSGFEIPGYVRVDGKYYKYNYERDNVYYCVDNIIIENFEVVRTFQQMERYIVFDYFILDLQEKKLRPYKTSIKDPEHFGWEIDHKIAKDPFIGINSKIKNIEVVKNKQTGNKIIYLYTGHKEPIEIEINKYNQMIRYKNNNIRKLPDYTLYHNKYLKELELNGVVKVGKYCLADNYTLENLSMKNVYEIGENFLYYNKTLGNAVLPKFFFINDGFLGWNQVFDEQPVGVKNRFVKFLKKPDITYMYGALIIVHWLISIMFNTSVKLTNKIMNKKAFDFTTDELTIKTIKKTSSLTPLIDFIISKQKKAKTLEEEKMKGISK